MAKLKCTKAFSKQGNVLIPEGAICDLLGFNSGKIKIGYNSKKYDVEFDNFDYVSDKVVPVFEGDSDWKYNAWLKNFSDRWYTYARGYKRAGDILFLSVEENGTTDLDIIVFPMLFNYRHFIELSLKIIFRDGSLLLGKNADYPTGHFISSLWTDAKEIMVKLWPEEDNSTLEEIEEHITEFIFYDEKSTAFRYPTEKGGRRSLEGVTLINVRRLNEIMAKLDLHLDGVILAIDAGLENKREQDYENSRWND